ncbi:MAG: hypothetical protein SGJ24_08790 [Chloroflexota bacterium]|nr:hypothetical protein [Chloroflexota bacterium]
MVQFTQTPYGGWDNCYTLSNGTIELVVTADVGPRVIRLGFPGGVNLFWENPEAMGVTSGDQWLNFGGHRLWHAPESQPRTYAPDNSPIHVEPIPNGVRLMQPIEASTGIEKQIDLVMHESEAHVQVTHRLRNTNAWAVTLAPWALSVMALGGTAIVPLPARGTHESDLMPSGPITLWSYTHMDDTRWTWGTKYIMLRSKHGGVPQKVGVRVPEGWAAYAGGGGLFVKFFDFDAGAVYPDYGSNCEVFTNQVMLEVESLGALGALAPLATVTHVEDWLLYPAVTAPTRDVEVETQIMPRVNEGRALTGR